MGRGPWSTPSRARAPTPKPPENKGESSTPAETVSGSRDAMLAPFLRDVAVVAGIGAAIALFIFVVDPWLRDSVGRENIRLVHYFFRPAFGILSLVTYGFARRRR